MIFQIIILKYKILIDDLVLSLFKKRIHKTWDLIHSHSPWFDFFPPISFYLAADSFEESWTGLLPPRDPMLLWKTRCTISGTGKSARDLT